MIALASLFLLFLKCYVAFNVHVLDSAITKYVILLVGLQTYQKNYHILVNIYKTYFLQLPTLSVEGES